VEALTNPVSIGTDTALKDDGTVWTWWERLDPDNLTKTIPYPSTPVQVTPIENLVSTDRGNGFYLRQFSNGEVWASGKNRYGQLGDGTTLQSDAFVRVKNLSSVTAIAAGSKHGLALKEDGTVWAWGSNQFGELGISAVSRSHPLPIQVHGLSDVTAIAAGIWYSVALKEDGTVWAWGRNTEGHLGVSIKEEYHSEPVQIPNLNGIISIAVYYGRSAAVDKSGNMWYWGSWTGAP